MQLHRGEVLEAVLADHLERLQLADLLLQRPAGLAEQVADHGRKHGGLRPGVPGEALVLDGAQGTAQHPGPLQQGDLVAELGQSRGAGHPAEASADHHHAHGGNPSGGSGSRHRRPATPG